MLQKIKKFMWKAERDLLLKRKRFAVRHSESFHSFCKESEKPKVILINTPEHGNLGDQAIAIAQQKFLKTECGICNFYEFTRDEYESCRSEIGNCVKEDDIFFLHGGGSIGTLWPEEVDTILHILDQFYANRIVIFPQSVYFEESNYGEKVKNLFCRAMEKCANLNIFVRDKRSYDILLQRMGMDQSHCFYVPDIVTYLNFEKKNARKAEILLCLRNDKEKVIDEKLLSRIIENIDRKHFKVVYVDTVIRKKISKAKRKKAIYKKLNEFSCSRLVITDRLHGMIFAAITGTPCIAVDNISQKVSGVYQWIKYLDYVRCVKVEEIDEKLVNELLQMRDMRYSNKELQRFYDEIKEIIQRIIYTA